jgi:hypothetical protein
MSPVRRLLTCIALCLVVLPAQADAKAHISVVNGRRLAAPPYLGFVVIETDATGRTVSCGGTAIRPNVLLTAAHCLTNGRTNQLIKGRGLTVFGQDDPYHALVGGTDIVSNPIVEFLVPRDFRVFPDHSLLADVAVLRLAQRVPGTLGILPRRHARLAGPGIGATILGWGVDTALQGADPTPLHRADLTIQSTQYCGSRFRFFLPKAMLCAWSRTSSPCFGDSGGPLLVTYGSKVVVAGVASTVRGRCLAGQPSLYTSLAGSAGAWVNKMAARLQKTADAEATPVPPSTPPVDPTTPPVDPATPPADPATPQPPQ